MRAKLIVLLLTTAILQVSASSYGQRISLSEKNAPLEQVLKKIKAQSGMNMFYAIDLFEGTKAVNVQLSGVSVTDALKAVLEKEDLGFEIKENTIIISKKAPSLLDKISLVIQSIARDLTVKGRVVDQDGRSLPNASIRVKGENTVINTNQNGEFEIKDVADDAVLLVSYVGYKTLEIPVKGAIMPLEIKLNILTGELEEVRINYATGYEQLSKERATGSFAKPDKTIFQNRVSTDVISRLEGTTSGLLFNRNLSGGASLEIRGRSTINADAKPLIVVDNFPYDGDISNINPNDVADVTVLKDAAAASIWGARAGNGVIVITTKRGSFNQPLRLNLTANLSLTEKPDLSYDRSYLGANEYINLEQDLYTKGFYDSNIANVSTYPVLSPVIALLAKQKAGTISPDAAAAQINALRNNDFRKELDKHFYRSASNQQYALSIDGGGQNTSYVISVGYDKGLPEVKGNTNNRITINNYGVFKPHEKIELSAGINYIKTNRELDNTLLILRSLPMAPQPYVRLADDMGKPLVVTRDFNADYIAGRPQFGFLNWQYVPLNEQRLADNALKTSDIRLRAGLKYIILPGLNLEGTYQYSNGVNSQRIYNAPESYYARNLINRFAQLTAGTVSGFNVPLGGILQMDNSSYTANNFRAQSNLDKTFNKVRIVALAGAEQREIKGDVNNPYDVYGYNPVNDAKTTVDFIRQYSINPSSSGTVLNIPGELTLYKTTNRYRSFFANASASYVGRYTVSGSIRLDQANIFGVKANDKQVPLYSIGGKWNLAQESFYKLNWLPQLQIRATYGFSGNLLNNGTAYTTAQYTTNTSPFYPNQTFQIQTPGNPNLTWEKLRTINLGLDFALKGEILSGNIDWYFKKGSDLIGISNVPSNTGFNTVTINYGEMKGQGLDVTLNSQNLKGVLNWTSGFLFSYTTDEVTTYDANAPGINGSSLLIAKGRPVNSLFLNKWAGLDPATGDPRGYDNTGAISTNYTAIAALPTDQKKWAGRLTPEIFGALRNTFTYGNASLSFNISYKFNYYFLRQSVSYSALYSGRNYHVDFISRWKKAGDEQLTNIPSAPGVVLNNSRDNFYNNAEILATKGDHMRLQDIILSYSFNRGQLGKLPIKNLQLSVLASNLGILWRANKYSIDPDYQQVSYLPGKTFGFSLKTFF